MTECVSYLGRSVLQQSLCPQLLLLQITAVLLHLLLLLLQTVDLLRSSETHVCLFTHPSMYPFYASRSSRHRPAPACYKAYMVC